MLLFSNKFLKYEVDNINRNIQSKLRHIQYIIGRLILFYIIYLISALFSCS